MKINISFEQKFLKNKDTEKIINAFGLSNIKKNVIVKDFDVTIQPKKIYYICGYSGSGKSSILREIHRQLKQKDNYEIIYIEKWQDLVIPNKPLIEFFNEKSTEERLSLLSKCGLGEAWKFVSYYNDLSDGEKFRFILYYKILTLSESKSTNKVLIFDEFCATLDRVTAKAISNNISKLRDKFGITFILASAHDDLIEYIHSDYTLFKEYHEEVKLIEKM